VCITRGPLYYGETSREPRKQPWCTAAGRGESNMGLVVSTGLEENRGLVRFNPVEKWGSGPRNPRSRQRLLKKAREPERGGRSAGEVHLYYGSEFRV